MGSEQPASRTKVTFRFEADADTLNIVWEGSVPHLIAVMEALIKVVRGQAAPPPEEEPDLTARIEEILRQQEASRYHPEEDVG